MKSCKSASLILMCVMTGGLFFLSSTQTVKALPISYDEALQGDLPTLTLPRSNLPWLGNLDADINSISGTVSRLGRVDDDTWDAFRVTLPQGFAIQYVEVSISNFTGLDLGSGGELDYHQIGTTTTYTHLFSGDNLSNLINIFPTTAAADYSLDIFPRFRSAFSWGVDISVEPVPVPEPATFFLVGSGLIGLIGVSRRKKA